MTWKIFEDEVHIICINKGLLKHDNEVQWLLAGRYRVLSLAVSLLALHIILPRWTVVRRVNPLRSRTIECKLIAGVLSEHLQDELLVLDMLDPLSLVNRRLWHYFVSEKRSLMDDEIDRSKFSVSNLYTGVAVKELFGWLRTCLLLLSMRAFVLLVIIPAPLEWAQTAATGEYCSVTGTH